MLRTVSRVETGDRISYPATTIGVSTERSAKMRKMNLAARIEPYDPWERFLSELSRQTSVECLSIPSAKAFRVRDVVTGSRLVKYQASGADRRTYSYPTLHHRGPVTWVKTCTRQASSRRPRQALRETLLMLSLFRCRSQWTETGWEDEMSSSNLQVGHARRWFCHISSITETYSLLELRGRHFHSRDKCSCWVYWSSLRGEIWLQKKRPQHPVADVELPKHRTEFRCIDISRIHKGRWHDQQRDSMTKLNRIDCLCETRT